MTTTLHIRDETFIKKKKRNDVLKKCVRRRTPLSEREREQRKYTLKNHSKPERRPTQFFVSPQIRLNKKI